MEVSIARKIIEISMVHGFGCTPCDEWNRRVTTLKRWGNQQTYLGKQSAFNIRVCLHNWKASAKPDFPLMFFFFAKWYVAQTLLHVRSSAPKVGWLFDPSNDQRAGLSPNRSILRPLLHGSSLTLPVLEIVDQQCPFGKHRGLGMVYHLSSLPSLPVANELVSSPSINQPSNGKRTSMSWTTSKRNACFAHVGCVLSILSLSHWRLPSPQAFLRCCWVR